MKGLLLGTLFVIGASASSVIYPCPDIGLMRFAHATSCTKYVQCIAGVPVIRECAEGLRYNRFTNQCRLPNLAICNHDEFLCPLFDDPNNLIYLSHNTDCSVYFLCDRGVPRRFECDTGLHWNIRNNTCDFPERANCRHVNIDCPEDDVTMVPHPHHCDRFFRCVLGEPHEARCPDEKYFDAILGQCYDRNYATCFLPSPPINTTPTPPVNTTPTPPVVTTPGMKT
ncbi:peritrophin-1-like [Phlebotomus argentipes]|uniref:peritrophin-1-like n=1 Tax=Phlebotomus argentipes TaxID=94469 RepID=UPI002892DD94|nr:peritrophin-1-like [Phlebotomus argentipes]